MNTPKPTFRVQAACAVLVSVLGGFGQAQAQDKDKPRLEIYGFIQADLIQDFNRVDPAWNATLRPSRIPVNCPGDAVAAQAVPASARRQGSTASFRPRAASYASSSSTCSA
jgi:hypothetical protein